MKNIPDTDIRVIIADDELLARKRIRNLLRRRSDIQIVAECAHGLEVCDKTLELKPDLLFLDIQMPEMDGLEVMRTLLPEAVPAVVFVTAYDQHAIRAFELHALDYLLKPFEDARFYDALDRALHTLGERRHIKNLTRLLYQTPRSLSHLARIPYKDGVRIRFIEASNIMWIEAEGKSLILHTVHGSKKIAQSMITFEERLDPEIFLRIHRSYIVNINAVTEMQAWHKGEYVVFLKDQTKLTTGRAFRANIDKILQR